MPKILPTIIEKPTRIEAAGNKPKLIDEYIGRINSADTQMSVAQMRSPEGWLEPGQRPEFREVTVVLKGMIRVEYEGGAAEIRAGGAIVCEAGEWIRYSTPEPGGAEYIAVCTPAFSPATVHRDD
jgi:quercetin dioxygenase-like cupin family protein